MAVLKDVKVADMKDGKVERVKYKGEEYVFTEENPKVGDIIEVDDGWFGLNAGDMFVCDRLDSGGDAVSKQNHCHYRGRYRVFRKVETEETAVTSARPADLESRADDAEKRISALEKGEDTAKPKTVKRRAKAGERILITDTLDDYEDGTIFEVTEENVIERGDVHVKGFDDFVDYTEYEVIVEEDSEEGLKDPRDQFANGDRVRLISGGGRFPLLGFKDGEVYRVSNVDYSGGIGGNRIEIRCIGRRGFAMPSQLEKVDEPALKVGDYAKVIGETYYGGISEGTIFKIAEERCYGDYDFKIDLIDGSDFDYAKPESLEKVELSDGDLTFIKIGREPGEYKTGDIVRVTENDAWGSRNLENDIGIITRVGGKGLKYFVHVPARGANDDFVNGRGAWHDDRTLKLIAPASARVDRN